MQSIKLIATDYDDTLVGRDNSMVLVSAFKNELSDLKKEQGTKWAIVTGRRFRDMTTALKMFSNRGLHPDYLIVSEGYIYVRRKFGFFPMLSWNLSMWRQKRDIKKRLRHLIVEWKRELVEKWPTAMDKSLGRTHVWYVFKSEDECQAADEFLAEKIQEYPELILFSRQNELYIGITFCCKGVALNEVGFQFGYSLNNILAVGDGPNDVSMLNGSSARMNACVGNACERLKTAVQEADGYIAEEKCVLGVVESIKHYREKGKNGR